MILATLSGPEIAQTRLRAALDECATLEDPDQQAWAMRHGFDAVLGMGGGVGPALVPGEVRQLLALALQIGVPALDLGDSRGCYEVYACVARLLVHGINVANGIKKLLRTALEEASTVPDVARQAWLLRQAFETLLNARLDDAESAGEEPNETAE